VAFDFRRRQFRQVVAKDLDPAVVAAGILDAKFGRYV